MKQKFEQHRTKLQVSVVLLMIVTIVVTLLYPGYPGNGRAEGAVLLDEGADGSAGEGLFVRFLAASGSFWQQVLSSALPKSLQGDPPTSSSAWGSTVATLLYQMRVSTPATLLALGIPALRGMALPDAEETLLPANEPAVPPLVEASEPPSAQAEALGWKSTPEMLIYHTHNIESYVPTSGKTHVYDNPDQTVMRVGARLAENLAAAGVDVTHSKADNSSQNYTLAYSYSLKNITEILAKNPSIGYTFDIHRDAGPRTLATTVIEGQSTARIYIVVGINTTLGHPNYQKNIAFANQLNDKLNQLYPGLSRGVRITDRSRYNQHVRDNALLIEVGTEQNTMDEALRAVNFLSEAIVAVAKDQQK